MTAVRCLDAVRTNPLTSKATIAEIEEEIKTWLRGAPDRHGGRARRAKKLVSRRRRDYKSRSLSDRSRDRSRSGGGDSSRPVVAGMRRSREHDMSRSRDRSRSQTVQYSVSPGDSSTPVVESGRRSRDSSMSHDRDRSPEADSSRRLASVSHRCRAKSTVVQSRSESSRSSGGSVSRSSGDRRSV